MPHINNRISTGQVSVRCFFFAKGGDYVNVTMSCTGSRLHIRFSGELDHHSASQARASIDRALDDYMPRECVVDMSGLEFMDSSGIALILCVVRRMRSCAGAARVVAPPGRPPRKVIDAAGISRVVRIDDSAEGGEN